MLKELKLQYESESFLKLSLGRFSYLPGSSEIFSNTNFFGAMNYIQLIENQGRSFYTSGDIFQITLADDALYLNSTLSLWPIRNSPIEPGSSWFPSSSVPNEFFTFSGNHYYQNNVLMDDAESLNLAWSNNSYGLEAGWSNYLFDISLQYYSGWDNEYLNQMDLELLDDEQFDIYIHPQLYRIEALALNWVTTLDSFHFWLDSSYIYNKSFVNSTLRVPGFITTRTIAPFSQNTAGFRYDFEWQDLIFLMEYRQSYIISDEARIVPPILDDAIAASFQMNLGDYRHFPKGFFLYSLDDKSWASAVQWKFVINDHYSLDFTSATLQGSEGSVFGQFDYDLYMALSLACQY